MDNMKIRVINKSKDGVKYRILDKRMPQDIRFASWDEFNKMYEQVDGFIYQITDEYTKDANDRVEWLTEQFAQIKFSMIKAENKDLVGASMLGGLVEDYCKKFSCAPIEFIEDYRSFEKMMIQQLGV